MVDVAEFEGRRQSDGGQRVVLALGECLGALFLGEREWSKAVCSESKV